MSTETEADDERTVVIEVDEAAVPHLQVERQGDTLRIGLEPGVGLMGDMTLRAEVTMPTLTGLAASGALYTGAQGPLQAVLIAIR